MMTRSITRRELLAGAAGTAAIACLNRVSPTRAAPTTASATTTTAAKLHRYNISASDWMMLKRQKPGALQLAKDCGLDGVEVDMGPLGKRPDFENNLVQDEFRNDYLAATKKLGLEISSLAMSAFYGQAVAEHPKAEQFASDWIELMGKLGTKVGFLPVILPKQDPSTTKLVALFKKVAPRAEKAGAVIGLNTSFDADANKKLLDDIGSRAVRIAYNCGEAIDANRDVYADLKSLGKERIAQIIPTLSDGVWLENDKRIDVPKLKGVLDDIGWSGWLVLQRSRDAKKAKDVRYNFGENAKYLKSIFQAAA